MWDGEMIQYKSIKIFRIYQILSEQGIYNEVKNIVEQRSKNKNLF